MPRYDELAPHILVHDDGPVRILTLNAPDRYNAIDDELHVAVATAWRLLGSDTDAGAAVLTGAGKAFSAGGDMSHIKNLHNDAAARRKTIRVAEQLVRGAVSCELPVVAAVNGPAIGLGATLALLCDLVVMDEDTYIADPHVSIGVVAGDGGAAVWPSYMGLLQAKEHLLLGTRICAAECQRLGIANRVAASGEVLDVAVQLGYRLANQPRQALRDTKRALNLHLRQAVDRALDFSLAAESESLASAEILTTVERFAARTQ